MLIFLKIIIIVKVITIIAIIMNSSNRSSSTKRVSGLYPIEVRACNAKPNCKHTEKEDDENNSDDYDNYHDYRNDYIAMQLLRNIVTLSLTFLLGCMKHIKNESVIVLMCVVSLSISQ